MDATLITDLPTSAQRVLAQHLRSSDAGNCRLTSKQLSAVRADCAGAHVWVVANTFRSQLHADARAAEASASKNNSVACDIVYDNLLAATSLVRAAQGVSGAHVFVDASRPCEQEVWQTLFRALLSSPTLHHLVVTECVTSNELRTAEAFINRGIQASVGVGWSTQSGGTEPSRRSSSDGDGRPKDCLPAADCAWLSALVAAGNSRAPQLSNQDTDQQDFEPRHPQSFHTLNLTLQLHAPLAPQHMQLLLQLGCMNSLRLQLAPDWLYNAAALRLRGARGSADSSQWYPGLSAIQLQHLRELPHLRSLSCTLTPLMRQAAGSQATMLQDLLQELGLQLTQLSLGSFQHPHPSSRVHFSLSAPFRAMPALQDLTCNLGFSLDADTDVEEADMKQIEASSAAGSAAAHVPQPAALLPSLTRLVLVERACVPDVLQRLVASEAACSQLQHLELPELMFDEVNQAPDWNEDMPQQQQQQRIDPAVTTLQLLSHLTGLQQLQAVVCGPQQLEALVSGVGSQLLGLTLTCQLDNFKPRGVTGGRGVGWHTLISGTPHLTSLKVLGSEGAMLDPQEDLPTVTQHLKQLRQLSFTGRMFTLTEHGCQLLPGMLPDTLQGLTLVVRQSSDCSLDTDCKFRVYPGALPQGLTSLKCRGFWWQRPDQVEPWIPWCGWEVLPVGLKHLELDVEAAIPGMGPGSILPVSAAAGQGGGVLRGPSADVEITSEVALQCATADIPYLAPLPHLESLALYLSANRYVAQSCNPKALGLGGLCAHLKGLTGLTHLHISSKLEYTQGDGLSALSRLVQLKVLSLDVALNSISQDEFRQLTLHDHGGDVPGAYAVQRQHVESWQLVEAMVDDLCCSLSSVAGLRVLRPPSLTQAHTHTVQRLEAELPNCLLVDAEGGLFLHEWPA